MGRGKDESETTQNYNCCSAQLLHSDRKKKRALRGGRKTSCCHHKKNKFLPVMLPKLQLAFPAFGSYSFVKLPSSEYTGWVNFGFSKGGRGVWLCGEATTLAPPSGPRPRPGVADNLDEPQMDGITNPLWRAGQAWHLSQVHDQHMQADLP